MSQPVRMDVTCYRDTVSIQEPMTNYLLVSVLSPQGESLGHAPAGGSPAAEIVLVLDRSGSMGARSGTAGRRNIDQIIDAAEILVSCLSPTDRVAIIGFDDDADVVLKMTPGDERGKIGEALASFRKRCESSGGLTNLRPALRAAMEEVGSRSSRIVVLTDGAATDPEDTLAYLPIMERQSIASLGFGEFDFDFMNLVCAPSKGICRVVDGTNGLAEVEKIFKDELKVAQDTVASNVRLTLEPSTFVQMHESWVAAPTITFNGPVQLGRQRCFQMNLPVVQKGGEVQALFSLNHLPRDAGTYDAATIELHFDVDVQGRIDETIRQVVQIKYSADHSEVNTVNRPIEGVFRDCLAERLRLEANDQVKYGDIDAAQATLTKIGNISRDPTVQAQAEATKVALAKDGMMSEEQSRSLQQATRTKVVG